MLGGEQRPAPYDHPVTDRYGSDVLANDPHRPGRPRATERPVEIGMVVEDAQTGYVGAVVRIEYGRMELENRHGRRKPFPVGPGYLIDGSPVVLTAPRREASTAASRTASGSVAVRGAKAKVALASRIYVEGRHDAELVEQVWGDDLRIEGVVVEHLGGVDDLVGIVEEFGPRPGRRLGVLVDHLVAGSKEARIASQIERPSGGDRVVRTPSSSATRSSTSGRRSSLAGSASRPGRSYRAARTGSTACAGPWDGRTRNRPTSPGHGSGSAAGCATGTTWSRHSSAVSRS